MKSALVCFLALHCAEVFAERRIHNIKNEQFDRRGVISYISESTREELAEQVRQLKHQLAESLERRKAWIHRAEELVEKKKGGFRANAAVDESTQQKPAE